MKIIRKIILFDARAPQLRAPLGSSVGPWGSFGALGLLLGRFWDPRVVLWGSFWGIQAGIGGTFGRFGLDFGAPEWLLGCLWSICCRFGCFRSLVGERLGSMSLHVIYQILGLSGRIWAYLSLSGPGNTPGRPPDANLVQLFDIVPGRCTETSRKPPRRSPDTNLVQLFDIVTGKCKEPAGNRQEGLLIQTLFSCLML